METQEPRRRPRGTRDKLPATPSQAGLPWPLALGSGSGEYRIDDIGGVEMLMQACSGLDRAESLAERIAADGDVVLTRSGPKVHPAVREELAARAFVVRTLQKLGLNYEIVKPIGRPTAGVGWGG